MYTEEDDRVRMPIVKFLVALILVILFILLLVWLLSKLGFNKGGDYEGLRNRMFNDNVQTMKETGETYFTKDRLPEKVGDSVVVTLKELIDNKYILPIKDFDGNKCDVEKSYISLTKKDNYYEMLVNLKCGDEEDYIIVDLGCYAYCESSYICEKETPVKPTPVKPTPVVSNPSCELMLTGTRGTNGWFTSNVTVAFKNKKPGNGASLVSYYLYPTNQNPTSNKMDRYVVTNEGTTTVHGYVKDSKGRTATCKITVKKDSVKPSCKLVVISGTKDTDGVYISNVVVGFNNRTDSTSKINTYGLTTSASAVYNKYDRFTVSQNGRTKVYGYVKDNAGNTASCDITVNKKKVDVVTSVPSCTLEVKSGTLVNGVYNSNVTVGFKSKQSTNGATITSFGLGKSLTYANNTSYVVNTNGTHTIYGYVKDSNGKTATCNIKVTRNVDLTSTPSCVLEVKSGTKENNYYLSNVTIGFKSKQSTNGATIASFGLGKSLTYANNTSYVVNTNGTHTIYGYVKDSRGKTATCSITITKKTKEYEYSKNIATQYSAWSAWTTYTYNPATPPQFGNYSLIQIENLGKTSVVDYYKETTGPAIYQNKQVKVGTATQRYCTDYNYYRVTSSTTTTTYAIKQGTNWVFQGMVTTSGSPTDTLSVKYEFVGFDWKCTGCERTPRKIWNKYTRSVGVASSSNTVTTSGIKVTCANTATRTIEIFDTVPIFVRYDIIKVPVYKDVYKYRRRTRTVTQQAYTDYKWSANNNNTTLLNSGYKLTGKTRVVV